ncbi:unnamed protein product, partial [Meganyctiphanes norvegica]
QLSWGSHSKQDRIASFFRVDCDFFHFKFKMFRLRVKTKTGGQFNLSERVDGNNTIADLRTAIKDLTSILPERQRILIGFPPKPVKSTNSSSLSKVGIRNGEVIIVEDVEPALNGVEEDSGALESSKAEVNIAPTIPLTSVQAAAAPKSSMASKTPAASAAHKPTFNDEDLLAPQGILLKKVVPSDNSCLFASLYYLMNGQIDTGKLREVRQVVANVIAAHPDLYNEGILEKSNKQYCDWILKDTSWGGAIELSILSEYYQIEIVAIDAKTGLLNRFGEDKFYPKRIIVMYDGIHYDPIHMETFEGSIETIFSSKESNILQQAQEIAEQAKHCGLYTDTNTFTLECKQCGFIIRGEEQALQHAKSTGHSKFEECRKQ